MNHPSFRNSPDKPFDLELDDLLHPARAFSHPRDVVSDPRGRRTRVRWKQRQLYAAPRVAPGRYRSMTFWKPCAPSTRRPSSKAPGKDSLRLKRKVAAWDDDFLASLLAA